MGTLWGTPLVPKRKGKSIFAASSVYGCNNNTAIETALRPQETLEGAHGSHSSVAWPKLPAWEFAHHSGHLHFPHCRSTLTAARLDFNSLNTPPVKHTLRVSGTAVTAIAPAHLVSRSIIRDHGFRGSPTVRSTGLGIR